MQIAINDQRRISGIQAEFNQVFPFLKLEFFSAPHVPGGFNPKTELCARHKTLGECRQTHTTGDLVITPSMTVSELEQIFRNSYGMGVQVFRKSGKVWLETTVTDGWTLQEQNRQGKELSENPSAP